MKKLILCIFFIFLCLLDSFGQDSFYRVNGTIHDQYNGRKATLLTFQKEEIRSKDSTIIANGKFTFTGKEYLNEPLSRIIIDGYHCSDQAINLFLERGNIELLIDSTYNRYGYKVHGTPLNDLYQSYQDSAAYYTQKTSYMLDHNQGGKIDDDRCGFTVEPNGILEKVYYQWGDFTMKFKKKNITNIVGEAVFIKELRAIRMYEGVWSHYTDSAFDILYEQCRQEVKEDPRVKLYLKRRKKDQELIAIQINTIGKKMEDIILSDTCRKDVHLLDFVGKGEYILMDVWASWCGPCIASLPVLKAIHQFGKDNNIKIIGISLDDNIPSWLQAINRREIPWLNFKIKDAATFKVFMKKYGIAGVPHYMLLDKEGNIIKIRDLPTEKELRELH